MERSDPTNPTSAGLPRPPARRSGIPSFLVMDVMAAAAERERAGGDVIHMEVGQPGTPAPATALDAVARALRTDKLGYTAALGLPALRERIAKHYREMYAADVAPEQVIVTTGSMPSRIISSSRSS